MNDMRRAIGTSIRSARCELRRNLQSSGNRRYAESDREMEFDSIMQRLDESIDTLNDTINRGNNSWDYEDDKESDADNSVGEVASLTNEDDENEKNWRIDTGLDEANDDQ